MKTCRTSSSWSRSSSTNSSRRATTAATRSRRRRSRRPLPTRRRAPRAPEESTTRGRSGQQPSRSTSQRRPSTSPSRKKEFGGKIQIQIHFQEHQVRRRRRRPVSAEEAILDRRRCRCGRRPRSAVNSGGAALIIEYDDGFSQHGGQAGQGPNSIDNILA